MVRRISFGRWTALIGVGVLIVLTVAALVRRDDILRTWLDPKQPFQTYRPPPAPDYAKPGGWALIPAAPALWSDADPAADVFFIHPTTFDGGRDWNGPIDDRSANGLLSEVMLPNYAGPFQRVGRVFAPRYRQASLYAYMTNKEDAQDSRNFAYGDVARAFQLFLADYNGGRPIVVVGAAQGGALAARLIHDALKQDPKLIDRLAAVYLIDTLVPADRYSRNALLPACTRSDEPRCVLAWQAAADAQDAAKLAKRTLIWSPADQLENIGDRPPLCVNPLLGAADPAFASARRNLGAANASRLEWGARPAFLPRQISAQCVDGFLRVSKPASPMLRWSGGWTDRLKAAPFNLFYANEEADAMARVAALTAAQGYVQPTPPIGASIVIQHAPVHRIL